MKNLAVLVSAQFVLELPAGTDYRNAEAHGADWLMELANREGVLDYRHPKVMGVYIRPVPVTFNPDADDIFESLMQI